MLVYQGYFFSTCQKYTIGSRKPTAEFVVAPRNAMTVLMLVKASENERLTPKMMRVHMRLVAGVRRFPDTSSIESLVGSTQNGVAKSTTTQMPKSEK